MKKSLVGKFGDAIQFSYVDIHADGMKNYPDIAKILGNVRLPLVVLNDEPRFHGGINPNMIEGAVSELLA